MGEWASVRLKDLVVDLFIGLSLHHAREGRHGERIVSVGDLRDGSVPPSTDLPMRELDATSVDERYRLRDGDVLVASRGTQLKVAWVREASAGAIATSTLLVLRAGERMLPAVLYAALSSPEGQTRLLARTKRSTSTLALTVREAAEVKVPVPPLHVQDLMARLVSAGEEQYRISTRLAAAERLLASSAAAQVLYDNAEPAE